jgi:uncharacterized membrane-anchored protein
MAESGLAGLVAGMVGANVAAKTGLLALGLLFLKKIGTLAAVVIVAVGVGIKRLFSRKGQVASEPKPAIDLAASLESDNHKKG